MLASEGVLGTAARGGNSGSESWSLEISSGPKSSPEDTNPEGCRFLCVQRGICWPCGAGTAEEGDDG